MHEHWNNAIDKQYSRNLGLAEGIELVALMVNREPPRLTLRKDDAHFLVSWPSSQIGYGLQTAGSLKPPVQWVSVTNGPVLFQAQNVVTNAITNSRGFYRLAK